MRDPGALTELLQTRLKKVEVPENYASLRKRLTENKPVQRRDILQHEPKRHGDRQQRCSCLQVQARPLDPIDLRLADPDALATCIQRAFDRDGDLTLCDLLA